MALGTWEVGAIKSTQSETGQNIQQNVVSGGDEDYQREEAGCREGEIGVMSGKPPCPSMPRPRLSWHVNRERGGNHVGSQGSNMCKGPVA